MNSWRTVFSQSKNVLQADEIITKEMVESGELKIGDYITPIKTFYPPKGSPFEVGKFYQVVSYYNSPTSPGGYLVLGSDGRKYLFDFNPNGGGNWFYKAKILNESEVQKLSPDEILGISWGEYPYKAMQIIRNTPGIKRNRLLEELALETGHIVNKDFKLFIYKMLSFMSSHNYILMDPKTTEIILGPAGKSNV